MGLLVSASLVRPIAAEITTAKVFSDHMVLQREKPVPVWGTADVGEAVTVSFAGQTKTATADQRGQWMVRLNPMPVSAEGRVLRIGEREITNVLVGEVWLGSGQSNMDLPVKNYTDPYEPNEKSHTKGQDLRLLKLSEKTYPTIRLLISGSEGWQEAKPAKIQGFSGLLFPFGVFLAEELNVPVGLIEAAANGSSAGTWVTSTMLQADPNVMAALRNAGVTGAFDERLGSNYTRRIAPLVPFALRGVLWDQGEGGTGLKGDVGKVVDWNLEMRALIRSWRREFAQGDFPWIYVQKPSGGGCACEPQSPVNEGVLPFTPDLPGPDIRGQLKYGADLKLGIHRESFGKLRHYLNTHMVVSRDLVGLTHPINKWGYGKRAARVALAAAYGREFAIYGPCYRDHQIEGGRVRIRFDHVGSGLAFRHGDRLQGFVIAGDDRVWHWADAVIDGDQVVVSSPRVPQPNAVRYSFSTMDCSWANLFNKDGLPALSFRTDHWEDK